MELDVRRYVAVVAIGRNEGPRLEACLRSARRELDHIVYVDSGSSDGSVELARAFGAETVELDPARPFSAARARNAGWRRVRSLAPAVRHVQFLDGDTELEPAWLEVAWDWLEGWPELAVVCGRRRERRRRASVYNLICDMEWARPAGVNVACGGDAMMRLAALTDVEGFDETIIAGEEPELCVRLWQRGWSTLRVDAPMTTHDADMNRFGEFWRRGVRAGHACAEAVARHGRGPTRHKRRELASVLGWAVAWPALALLVARRRPAAGGAMLLAYPLHAMWIAWRAREQGRARSLGEGLIWALACIVGRWAQVQGMARFVRGRLRGRCSGIIEYKPEARRRKGTVARSGG